MKKRPLWLSPKQNVAAKPKAKLTIELVPKTCWFSNVRSAVSSADWDKLKRHTAGNANRVCEICENVGPQWPVECHEIWEYDDKKHVQKLAGLIALCPSCHQVKHIGFAQIRGKLDEAIRHLRKVNGLTANAANKYVGDAFKKWRERSEYDWTLDISWLDQFDVKVIKGRN